MTHRSTRATFAVAAFFISACSANPGGNQTAEAASAAANAANRAAEAASASANAAATAMNGAAQAAGNAATATASLAIWTGKHPSEAVDGATFRRVPAVRAAVSSVVTDAAVRGFVLDSNGPDAPIVMKEGRVLAWGCETHNCGYHNWSISITPDGASAEVCFYRNPDSADGRATWYLPGGRTEQRPGNCPSE